MVLGSDFDAETFRHAFAALIGADASLVLLQVLDLAASRLRRLQEGVRVVVTVLAPSSEDGTALLTNAESEIHADNFEQKLGRRANMEVEVDEESITLAQGTMTTPPPAEPGTGCSIVEVAATATECSACEVCGHSGGIACTLVPCADPADAGSRGTVSVSGESTSSGAWSWNDVWIYVLGSAAVVVVMSASGTFIRRRSWCCCGSSSGDEGQRQDGQRPRKQRRGEIPMAMPLEHAGQPYSYRYNCHAATAATAPVMVVPPPSAPPLQHAGGGSIGISVPMAEPIAAEAVEHALELQQPAAAPVVPRAVAECAGAMAEVAGEAEVGMVGIAVAMIEAQAEAEGTAAEADAGANVEAGAGAGAEAEAEVEAGAPDAEIEPAPAQSPAPSAPPAPTEAEAQVAQASGGALGAAGDAHATASASAINSA